MNFCPVCGAETKNTFCKEHTEISFNYKDIIVKVCECKRYFYRSRWVPFESLKSVVKKVAKDCIKENVEIEPLTTEEIIKKKIEIKITYQGEEFIIPGKIIVERCPPCSKKGTPFFVSTMQIRPKDDELLEFVKAQVKHEKDAFISNIIELKEGYNVLLSTNKAALNIGKKLSKSFKGELKTSRHLFGHDKQRSKDVYRVTVCFRKQ